MIYYFPWPGFGQPSVALEPKCCLTYWKLLCCLATIVQARGRHVHAFGASLEGFIWALMSTDDRFVGEVCEHSCSCCVLERYI